MILCRGIWLPSSELLKNDDCRRIWKRLAFVTCMIRRCEVHMVGSWLKAAMMVALVMLTIDGIGQFLMHLRYERIPKELVIQRQICTNLFTR